MSNVRINVVGIQLVKERTMNYAYGRKIGSPHDAARLLADYLDEQDREHFVVLISDTKHQVQAIHTVAVGSLNACIVHPREVFKPAVLNNAAAIVVCHNHPSGDPAPSQEDIDVTKRLVEAGQILGIEVLDHIILGANNQYVSLREKGHM